MTPVSRPERKGLRNAVITNGFINPEPLAELIKAVEAIKIDLKAFNQDFYTNYVRGELKPVLESIKQIARSRVWLEIVYLVIPTLNDKPEEIRQMAHWLKQKLVPTIRCIFRVSNPCT